MAPTDQTPAADTLSHEAVEAYLARIGLAEAPDVSLTGLTQLQSAHLNNVPFENLDVAAGVRVHTNLDHSIDKVVNRRRGGWCFELNGAFGALLATLGFPVIRLGAAVLLDGPNATIDHLCLEVALDQPYLVDVGFGESFTIPLPLNSAREQDGGAGVFQFIASPQGTTLAKIEAEVPVAQYRFKRVGHTLDDFTPASDALQDDTSNHWNTKPFATRLIDDGPKRVTLLMDRLKFHGEGQPIMEEPVGADRWDATLREWFGIDAPARP